MGNLQRSVDCLISTNSLFKQLIVYFVWAVWVCQILMTPLTNNIFMLLSIFV